MANAQKRTGTGRTVAVVQYLPNEEAAAIIRNNPPAEAARILHKTRAALRVLKWKLRENGYDCGDDAPRGRSKGSQ